MSSVVKHVSSVSEEAVQVGGASGRSEGRAAAARESKSEAAREEFNREKESFFSQTS